MTAKPVVPCRLAERDIDEGLSFYLDHAGQGPALAFVDAVEHAFHQIGANPAIGWPRYSHELGLPGLRSWPLHQVPYLVFYVEHVDHIDVWRVLHSQRDIPAYLQ